jgi:adenylate kinase family enzyme
VPRSMVVTAFMAGAPFVRRHHLHQTDMNSSQVFCAGAHRAQMAAGLSAVLGVLKWGARSHSQRPHPLKRIVVLGCAGSGKTTFSRRLAQRLGAAAVVLDEVWRPGLLPEEVPAFRALVSELHAGEAWISDGNFAVASFDLRLPRADLVVWIDRPRWVCAWRASLRVFRRGESHRLADLPKAWAFIRGFERINRPRIEALRLAHGPSVPVVRLTSDRQIAAFIAAAPSLQLEAVAR